VRYRIGRAGNSLPGERGDELNCEANVRHCVLATSGDNGVTPSPLSAHGFDASIDRDLGTRSETLTAERFGRRQVIAIARVRITGGGGLRRLGGLTVCDGRPPRLKTRVSRAKSGR